ncbi:MAG: preprotein translocase subunit SecG [Lachnospiraceae bacterium]|nr:preprotein translocase subunit SecG [Lachnospiraceae bacterium]
MGTLRLILTIIYIIDCVFLAVVVLMQEGKSAGLGSISGAAESYWGKNKGRSMEGKLVTVTKVAAVLFLVLSAVLNINKF